MVSAVESLSDRVLAQLDKGHTRADVFEALRITRAAGLTLRPSLVSFTPWTTLDDYLEPPGKPILETMLRIYGGLLDEIECRRYDVFSRRVALSRSRKLWIAGSVLLRHKLGMLSSRDL